MTRPVELADAPEILAAVDWWTAKLTQFNRQDGGDAEIEAWATLASSYINRPAREQCRIFRECLMTALAVHCAESWRPEQPQWGSGCRVVGCDYGPDAVLRTALSAARIDGGGIILPIKTAMWINPGSVVVREGYGGQEMQIWPEETKQ